MSYARWNCDGSDVYVYGDYRGFYCCQACGLLSGANHYRVDTIAGMIDHLVDHVLAGDCVPNCTFDQLEKEED